MKSILVALFLVAACSAAPQRTINVPPESTSTDNSDDSNSASKTPAWNWSPYGMGCPCMAGYGPGPRRWGWGHPGAMQGRGWGFGGRRGMGWGPGPMRGWGWGPAWWQNPAAQPDGNSQQWPVPGPDSPFMPWYLYDLTPEQRQKFYDEIGDNLPPPMTYERRIRILEALRKATS